MIYVFADYELDTRLYELRQAGRRIPVEPLAFKALLYLVRHRDRVVSKDELLEHLWPSQFVSNWSLVQGIVKARKALSDNGHTQRYVQTIMGHGYRFIMQVEEREAQKDEAQTWTALPLPPIAHSMAPSQAMGARQAETGKGPQEHLLLGHGQELMALYELLVLAQTRLAAILHTTWPEEARWYAQSPRAAWLASPQALLQTHQDG